MNMINQYVNYLNIALIVIAVIVLIVFFVRLSKTMKKVTVITNDGSNISYHLNTTKEKLDIINKTQDSWDFFGSLGIIYLLLKDTLKYKKRSGSLKTGISRSVSKHSRQLSRIKL